MCSFYRGLFDEELGNDFFGFKDLGLDQEYSMSSLQIPTKLWFKNDESRLKKMAQGKTNGMALFFYVNQAMILTFSYYRGT